MSYSWAEDAVLEGNALNSVSLQSQKLSFTGPAGGLAPNGCKKETIQASGMSASVAGPEITQLLAQVVSLQLFFFLFKGDRRTLPPTSQQKLKFTPPGCSWWEGSCKMVGMIRTSPLAEVFHGPSVITNGQKL